MKIAIGIALAMLAVRVAVARLFHNCLDEPGLEFGLLLLQKIDAWIEERDRMKLA